MKVKEAHTYFRRTEKGYRWSSWPVNGRDVDAQLSFGSYDGFLLEIKGNSGDSDRALRFTFALPHLMFFSVAFDCVFPTMEETRSWSVGYYIDTFSLAWNHSEYFGKHLTGWRRSWNIPDTLLGRAAYSSEDLQSAEVIVPLPEGPYRAKVVLSKATWKRPLWPWARTVYRAEVTPDKPLPIQGKGENDWDQGENAIHNLTLLAKTLHEAVAGTVKSVLRARERYGVPDSVKENGHFILEQSEAAA